METNREIKNVNYKAIWNLIGAHLYYFIRWYELVVKTIHGNAN